MYDTNRHVTHRPVRLYSQKWIKYLTIRTFMWCLNAHTAHEVKPALFEMFLFASLLSQNSF